MTALRCAVVGVGYLGKFHAQKYAAAPDAELVAVVDADPESAQRVATENGCQALTDYHELLGKVDAVSIAVPTTLHHQVARDFLQAGAHVLVEKPITVTPEEAGELVDIAAQKNLVLQVGHLERFNAAILGLGDRLAEPMFIESHRLAPFKPRATDVNVVLDLMIHDIDIILDIVKSEVVNIAASGAQVLSSDIDIANARLEFANGCVANVTASRISMKMERKMRLFQRDAYIAIDFQNKGLTIHRKGEGEMFPGVPEIKSEETFYEESDALNSEILAFLNAIRTGTPPPVSGEDGKRALETAMRITDLLAQSPNSLN
ncbi:MAG: Gfo/Idh/MocA family oxidoreductase [Gammaproteobacteria bacterium]